MGILMNRKLSICENGQLIIIKKMYSFKKVRIISADLKTENQNMSRENILYQVLINNS